MGAVFTIVLTASGCSKTPGQPTAQAVKLRQELSIPADTPLKDFGVVELIERTPKQLSLPEGKDCVLTVTTLADGNLQMVFTSESTMPGGLPTRVEQTATVPSGRQVVCSVDGVGVALMPIVKVK